MILIKILIYLFNFSGMALDVKDGTRRKTMVKPKGSLEARHDLQRMKKQDNLHPEKIDDGRNT